MRSLTKHRSARGFDVTELARYRAEGMAKDVESYPFELDG
jgi:hypothetical protein